MKRIGMISGLLFLTVLLAGAGCEKAPNRTDGFTKSVPIHNSAQSGMDHSKFVDQSLAEEEQYHSNVRTPPPADDRQAWKDMEKTGDFPAETDENWKSVSVSK